MNCLSGDTDFGRRFERGQEHIFSCNDSMFQRVLSPINWRRQNQRLIPLLPGTLTIYSTRGSQGSCVGFLGYAGGLEASAVTDESDLASTGPWLETVCAMGFDI